MLPSDGAKQTSESRWHDEIKLYALSGNQRRGYPSDRDLSAYRRSCRENTERVRSSPVGCCGEAHRATLSQANAALYGQQNVGVDMDGMLCADCGAQLQPDEVYVCETCDREQRKFIGSVMGDDGDD
ncbi:hypothetical protein FOT58_18875 [Serratia nematodiphila]|nr:hypothetical protein FOT58_18875 [Serratia nematodiphila]